MTPFPQAIAAFLAQHWADLLWPAAIFVGVLLAGLVTRRVVFKHLRAWAGKTESKLDDVLMESLHGPVLLWVIILGIHLATDLSKLPAQALQWSHRALVFLWIVSITLALSRLAGRMVRTYEVRGNGLAGSGTLSQTLATLVVALLGALTLLDYFGISITPILTALGVGGIAVALALQDTLSNLFAGFYVSLARQVRLGDFIQLESGQQGYVSDIGWRNTTLLDRAHNLILIPNNKMAQSIVTNYHLPEALFMLKIHVGVSYASDPERVESVLLDVVHQATGEVPGLLADPAPVALFMPGFGDFSLDFTLMCHVENYDAQFPVQHELRKRIFRRFHQEGIVIPFPTRTLEFRNPPPKVQ